MIAVKVGMRPYSGAAAGRTVLAVYTYWSVARSTRTYIED
jgi:hypothetical protein